MTVALEIADGSVNTGDTVGSAIGDRTLEAPGRSVEFLDHDVGSPGQRAEQAILVDGLEPSTISPSTQISSV